MNAAATGTKLLSTRLTKFWNAVPTPEIQLLELEPGFPGMRRRRTCEGQRFGLHNLRHSLSTWLVNKGKVDPKTVQGMLRHSDIRTTMNLYTQDDHDEKQAAQGAFLSAVGLGSRLVQ
jgi:integrase